MKFKLREKKKESSVEMFLEIDDGGDVNLKCTDGEGIEWIICYIDSDTGKLFLYESIRNDLGFALDGEGRIVVAK